MLQTISILHVLIWHPHHYFSSLLTTFEASIGNLVRIACLNPLYTLYSQLLSYNNHVTSDKATIYSFNFSYLQPNQSHRDQTNEWKLLAKQIFSLSIFDVVNSKSFIFKSFPHPFLSLFFLGKIKIELSPEFVEIKSKNIAIFLNRLSSQKCRQNIFFWKK